MNYREDQDNFFSVLSRDFISAADFFVQLTEEDRTKFKHKYEGMCLVTKTREEKDMKTPAYICGRDDD